MPLPHGHLTALCFTFCCSPLIITLVLFIFTIMPLFSTLSFHLLSLLIRSPWVSAITTRSSAYNNCHGKATLNSLNNLPWLSQIAKDLMLNYTYQLYLKTITVTINCSYHCFLYLCRYTWLAILTILQLPTYALAILLLLSEPYWMLFPNPQSEIRAFFL